MTGCNSAYKRESGRAFALCKWNVYFIYCNFRNKYMLFYLFILSHVWTTVDWGTHHFPIHHCLSVI